MVPPNKISTGTSIRLGYSSRVFCVFGIMANEQNLKPGAHKLTVEEQSRGGKRSAEVRRENKLIKERILERMGEDDWDLMIDKLIERATEDTKSFETLRDTIGQKPKEQVEMASTIDINVVLEDED